MPALSTTLRLAGKSLRDEDDSLEAGPNEERKKKRRTDDIPTLRSALRTQFWRCDSITFLIVVCVCGLQRHYYGWCGGQNRRGRAGTGRTYGGDDLLTYRLLRRCSACEERRYSVRGKENDINTTLRSGCASHMLLKAVLY